MTRIPFEEILDSFLEQPELDATLQRDTEIYQAALARAGLDGLRVDPVSLVYVRFDGDVTLAGAAGDLGVTPDELGDELVFLSKQACQRWRTRASRRCPTHACSTKA